MKSITIEGTLRDDLGSKFAKQLRKEGNVPCVIYGGDTPIHFYTDHRNFSKLIYTPAAYTVDFKLGDTTVKAVMQDIQFHPVTDKIEHVDFIQLVAGKEVKLDIPVKLIGNAKGVRNGGKLKNTLRNLKVRATEENLPDSIDLNIENLRIGQSIRVSDIKTEGYSILNAESAVIVSIKTSRNAVDEEDEEVAEAEGEEEATAEAATAEAEAEA